MIREQNLQVADAPNMAYDAVLTAGNFKPILFSTPMVQAILRGEKTQTRRIVKSDEISEKINLARCKYKVGDILWVRETFTILEPEHCEGMSERFYYKADHHDMNEDWRLECIRDGYPYKWKPSLFMPRSACRIFLKIKSIRVEKLNNISEADAISEGIIELSQSRMQHVVNGRQFFNYLKKKELFNEGLTAKESYKTLWQKINGEKSWKENPFVWVYEFERSNASFACS